MTRTSRVIAATMLSGMAVTGCGNGNQFGSPVGPSPIPPTPAGLEATLGATIQDEMAMLAVYEGVLQDFGPVDPFVTVVNAERQHVASLAQLLVRRDLPVPAPTTTPDTIPHFATLTAACEQASGEELSNVALYDTYLATTLPNDVFNVFSNNRAASLENHLPAFERCR